MSDKIILVTPPDDVLIDGLRILLVDLNPAQTELISDSLKQLTTMPNIITYVWNTDQNIDWLLDKKHKSWLTFFNADSENDVIIGYMAAQVNSYYFGTLKTLGTVNDSAIYNIDQIINILEKYIENHARKTR